MVRETGDHWEVKWTGITIISEGTELLELSHIEMKKLLLNYSKTDFQNCVSTELGQNKRLEVE